MTSHPGYFFAAEIFGEIKNKKKEEKEKKKNKKKEGKKSENF
jgi:hypothetical protein